MKSMKHAGTAEFVLIDPSRTSNGSFLRGSDGDFPGEAAVTPGQPRTQPGGGAKRRPTVGSAGG